MKEFFDIAAKWSDNFRVVICSALVIKQNSDSFLSYASVNIGPFLPPSYDVVDVKTAHIRAIRKVWELNEQEAKEFIGRVITAPNSISLPNFSYSMSPAFPPADSRWAAHYKSKQRLIANPNKPGPLRLPTLEVYGPVPLARNLELLDLELASAVIPYDNITELMAELNLPIKPPPPFERARIDWTLFPPIELTEEKLSHGTLRIKVRTHPNIKKQDVRFTAKRFEQINKPPRRGSIDPSDLNWTAGSSENIGILQTKMPDTKVAEVIATCRGELSARWWIGDTDSVLNDRMTLQKAAFGEYNYADDFFVDRDEFENKIALTLTLLGLTCLHYGEISKLKDMCDILAITEKRHVFVVECTTGRLDQRGKLLKLRDRFNAIKDRLSMLPRPPLAVVPVIFTALPREETVSDWPAAAAFGISVFGKNEILAMLSRLAIPPNADEIYAAVTNNIPHQKADSDEGTTKPGG